ncbi:MAG: hypothetical protein JWR45_736 [Blastococcus sp.]|jgi:hypothetical protein|nr:hypothetical protein [Blastococcus sp.]
MRRSAPAGPGRHLTEADRRVGGEAVLPHQLLRLQAAVGTPELPVPRGRELAHPPVLPELR